MEQMTNGVEEDSKHPDGLLGGLLSGGGGVAMGGAQAGFVGEDAPGKPSSWPP